MNLTKKVLWFIISIFVFSIVTIYLGSKYLVEKKFDLLETAEIENNLERANNALSTRIKTLVTLSTDYATWDDTYAYVQDHNEDYIESNLVPETFKNAKIELAAIFDKNGNVLYKKIYDINTGEEVEFTQETSDLLLEITKENQTVSGILLLPKKTLLLSSRPVLKSNGEGPAEGTLIMGRFVDDEVINNISDTVNLKMDIVTLDSISDFTLLDTFKKSDTYINKENKDNITAFLAIPDITGKKDVAIKIQSGRDMFIQGQETVRLLLLFVIGCGIVSVLLGNLILNSILVRPINKLINNLQEVRKDRKNTSKLAIEGNDELSIIAKEINQLLDQVDSTEQKLIEFNKHIETVIDQRTGELQEEHERLVTAISATPYGFVLFNMDKQVILNNTTVLSILGLDHIDYALFTKMISQDDVIKRSFEKVVAIQDSIKVDGIVVGNKFINLYVKPIVKKDLAVTGVIYIVMDVTESKLLERSKDEFFAIASHELKTPLTAIKGNISLIKDLFYDKITDETLRAMFDDINTAAQRMLRIVNDFLATSKLDQGKMVFDIQNVQLDKVVDRVMQEWSSAAKEKNITIKFNPVSPLEELEVYADKEKTKEVLSNLISNSIKFMDQGEINITATKLKNFVEIEVKDNGKGISEENKKLLFKKFQQASTNIYARDVSQGTGLGLYICKLIIEGMQGKISLRESTVGVGTSFVFTLPVKRA